jgi:hypothetical protein
MTDDIFIIFYIAVAALLIMGYIDKKQQQTIDAINSAQMCACGVSEDE